MAIRDVSDVPVARLFSLTGKVAAVTGGARGIGYAIASRFAEAGAQVAIGDLDETAAKEAADRLERKGYRAEGMRLDVSDHHSVENFADQVVRDLGYLDIWVNNAGIYPMAPILEMTDDQWSKVLGVDLDGTFWGAKTAAERMDPDKGGVIINLASTAGYRGFPGMAHYVAAKHAVRGLTRTLAAELAPMNIRVLALAPTLIETPGIEAAKPMFEQAGTSLDEFAEQIPLGRTGTPDDVARVALFCASDASMFMTGSTLPVDGGQLAV